MGGPCIGCAAAVLLLLTSSARSAEICGRPWDSFSGLLALVQSDPELRPAVMNGQYLTFQTSGAGTLLWAWAFTRPEHAAHPAVVCRKIQQGTDRNWHLSMWVRCGGPKSACDRLWAEFSDLNDKMRKGLEGR